MNEYISQVEKQLLNCGSYSLKTYGRSIGMEMRTFHSSDSLPQSNRSRRSVNTRGGAKAPDPLQRSVHRLGGRYRAGVEEGRPRFQSDTELSTVINGSLSIRCWSRSVSNYDLILYRVQL